MAKEPLVLRAFAPIEVDLRHFATTASERRAPRPGSRSTPMCRLCENSAVRAPTGALAIPEFGADMSKRARKRRSRKGNAANHGRKPNA